MDCPRCGREGFDPRTGCMACGYDGVDASETQEDGTGVSLSELNRMLASLGVEPITDVGYGVRRRDGFPGTETAAPDEVAPMPSESGSLAPVETIPHHSAGTEPAPTPEVPEEPAPAPKVPEEPAPAPAVPEEPAPDFLEASAGTMPERPAAGPATLPVPGGTDMKRHLRAARHTAAPLRRAGQVLEALAGWAGALAAVPLAVLGKLPAMWKRAFASLRTPRSTRMSGASAQSGGSSENPYPETVPAAPGDSAGVYGNEPSGAPAAVEPASRMARKGPARTPSRAAGLVFWVGTPVLVVLLTVLLVLGVLRLRTLVQAGRVAPAENTRFEYIPWTPEPMPVPDPVEIIEMDPAAPSR